MLREHFQDKDEDTLTGVFKLPEHNYWITTPAVASF